MRGRAIFLLALLALAAVLVTGYLRHRTEAAEEDDKEHSGQVGQAAEGRGPGLLALESATIKRIGLKSTVLVSGRGVSELTLTGEIVSDPQGTSTLRAPLAGRLSSVGRPWPSFGQLVQAGEEVAQVSDAKPLTIPRSGEVIRVSVQPGEQVAAGQEILVIADFEHPLARLAWRDEAPATPPHTIPVARLGQERQRVIADLVGAAPDADPVTRRPAYLYRVRSAWANTRPGTAVVGFVPGAAASTPGVQVPVSGVVQWEGLAWVYVEQEPGKYLRTAVSTDRPVSGGWIVSSLKPGERVVTQGAEQLLSEEFRAGITVGEEVGE
jgi:biotin carboxyl carrier protein